MQALCDVDFPLFGLQCVSSLNFKKKKKKKKKKENKLAKKGRVGAHCPVSEWPIQQAKRYTNRSAEWDSAALSCSVQINRQYIPTRNENKRVEDLLNSFVCF